MTRRILLFLILLSCSLNAAAEKPAVYFAGIVYLGSFKSVEANYPYTLALNADGSLDKALLQELHQLSSPYFELKTGLANLNEGQSLVMAVGIEREFLSQENYLISGASSRRLIADLTVQLLVIDFKTMTLQAAFPMSVARNDIVSGRQSSTPDQARALFGTLYLDPAGGVLKRIAQSLTNINPQRSPRYRLGVSSVTSLEAAQRALPGDRDNEQVENFIGQLFCAELAKRYNLQVIPYSRDYAIGGQMSARFANGKVYNLKLPKPDYEFGIVLQKYEKVADQKHWVYGSYIRLQMREELRKVLYIDDDFRFGVPKLAGENLEDWPAYEDAIESLLADLAAQLQKPERSWFDKHARNGSKTYQQFVDKKDIFRHEEI